MCFMQTLKCFIFECPPFHNRAISFDFICQLFVYLSCMFDSTSCRNGRFHIETCKLLFWPIICPPQLYICSTKAYLSLFGFFGDCFLWGSLAGYCTGKLKVVAFSAKNKLSAVIKNTHKAVWDDLIDTVLLQSAGAALRRFQFTHLLLHTAICL